MTEPKTFDITLQIKTIVADNGHALRRIKSAFEEYVENDGEGLEMEILSSSAVDVTPKQSPPRFGLGSKFTKVGWDGKVEKFMIASCGYESRYVLVRINDGCWSVSARSLDKLLDEMLKRDAFTLTAAVGSSREWTGKVDLDGN